MSIEIYPSKKLLDAVQEIAAIRETLSASKRLLLDSEDLHIRSTALPDGSKEFTVWGFIEYLVFVKDSDGRNHVVKYVKADWETEVYKRLSLCREQVWDAEAREYWGAEIGLGRSSETPLVTSKYAQPQKRPPNGTARMVNTSGQGKASVIPNEIKGWNWGAFLLPLIWGLSHRVWLSLLCFIPFVNIVMVFVLGARGNEWAWQNQKWNSIEHFQKTQRTWALWGLTLLVLGIIIFIVIFLAAGSEEYATSKIPFGDQEDNSNVQRQTPRPTPVSTPRGYIYTNGSIEVGGDGEPIELVNNPNATNPSFAKLVAFINRDPTDKYSYIVGPPKVAYVCSDFAEDVHNNAEAAGIRAAWVGIDIYGKGNGHAINAFETTDVGLVFIDCTGKGLWSATLNESSWDRRAHVEMGKQYGVRDINGAATWFELVARIPPAGMEPGDRIIEWLQNHRIRELAQKWMDEWLIENRTELSECGWIREPMECYGGTTGGGGEAYKIGIGWRIGVDCIEAPWFRQQLDTIVVDGIPVTWNVTLHEQWMNPQLGVVKDIHIHW